MTAACTKGDSMAVRPGAVHRERARLARESDEVSRAQHALLVVVREAPLNAEASPAALQSFLTPSAGRFLRANFAVPCLSARTHAVEVGGCVERRFTLRRADLAAFPRRTVTVTTECAGNHRTSLAPLPPGEPWHAGAVSTGRWSGIPLAAVLEKAGLLASCREVLAAGADHGQLGNGSVSAFERSLPRSKALDPD